MNIKLICASLAGVSSIGGAVAGGMYLSKSKNSEAKTDSTTKEKPKPAETQAEATAPVNKVTEQTGQNVAQNTSSSSSSSANVGTLPALQETSLNSGRPNAKENL